jgi:acyl-coenzyme A thioesterase PaaI-like protein
VPFAARLGVEVVAATPVTGRVAWRESLCTAGGALNGGVVMALADDAGARCAFLNLPAGARGTTTTESKTNFPRGPVGSRDGDSPSVACRSSHHRSRIRRSRRRERLVARVTQSQAVL